jgi:hypothetical protein
MKSKTKYEIIAIDSVEFTVDVSLLMETEDMFFNATEIAKKYYKKPIEWLSSKQANDYIQVILKVENLHFEDLVRTIQGGKYKGTWLHNKLALPFARWCNVEFEYLLDCWIRSRIDTERGRKNSRIDLKTGCRPLTNAIESKHEEPKPYHFSNELNMINRLVTGMDAKKFKEFHCVDNVRDALDASDMKKMAELQRHDTTLIELGFDYQKRKELLTQYIQNKFLRL